MCSYLQSLHVHIAGYETGGHKVPVSASGYAVHMKEAKQWNAAFRAIYVMGGVPSEFQGSAQAPLRYLYKFCTPAVPVNHMWH